MVAIINPDGTASGSLPLVIDRSGAIVAKNVAQNVFAENPAARSRSFVNASGADMWVKECIPGNAADAAAVNAAGSVLIKAGGSAKIYSGNRFSIISDAAGAVGAIYTAKES